MISIIESQPYSHSPVSSVHDYSNLCLPSHDRFIMRSLKHSDSFENSISAALLNSLYEKEFLREMERRRILRLAEEKERQRQLKLSYLRQQELLKIPMVKTAETEDHYEIGLFKRRGSFDSYNIEKNIAMNGRDFEISVFSRDDNFCETFVIRDASNDLEIKCFIENNFLHIMIPKNSFHPQLQHQSSHKETINESRNCFSKQVNANNNNNNSFDEFFSLLLGSAEGINSNFKQENSVASPTHAELAHLTSKDHDKAGDEQPIQNTRSERKSEGIQSEVVQSNEKPRDKNEKESKPEDSPMITKRSDLAEISDTESIESEYEKITPSKLSRQPSLEEVEDEEITRYKKSQSDFQS